MLEDEHHPIFERVNSVDVFLVLGLNFQKRAHEAHPLQVA